MENKTANKRIIASIISV